MAAAVGVCGNVGRVHVHAPDLGPETYGAEPTARRSRNLWGQYYTFFSGMTMTLSYKNLVLRLVINVLAPHITSLVSWASYLRLTAVGLNLRCRVWRWACNRVRTARGVRATTCQQPCWPIWWSRLAMAPSL